MAQGNWKESPFSIEELAHGLTVSAAASHAGAERANNRSLEGLGNSREGRHRLNSYTWKNTFLSLASEFATAKNIREWSILQCIREKRLKKRHIVNTTNRRRQCQDSVGFILWPALFLDAVL